MKLFTCPSCNQVLYFENTRCQSCGSQVAYLAGEFVVVDASAQAPVPLCRNYVEHDACNWTVHVEGGEFCESCALNEVIPNLEGAESRQAWVRLETAKRRLLTASRHWDFQWRGDRAKAG